VRVRSSSRNNLV